MCYVIRYVVMNVDCNTILRQTNKIAWILRLKEENISAIAFKQ